MQKHNNNSNRRNFGNFEKFNNRNEKIPQKLGDEFYCPDILSEKYGYGKVKSYRFVSLKTAPKNSSENSFTEIILCVVLVAAAVTAAICMCLAIGSMFMFFSI